MIPKYLRLKAWAHYNRMEAEEPKLRTLFWETTLRCNLSCRHCGSNCQKHPYPDELTTEEIIGAFRQIAEAYDPRGIMISVSGGEPLLREDVFEVMSEAHRMGFNWGMTTNGFMVDDKIVQRCIDSGMKTLSISVDGLKDSHNEMRQHPESFDRAVNALRLFKESKAFYCVQATSCFSSKTLSELQAVYELMLDTGVDSWRVMNIFPYGRANRDLTLSPVELKQLLEFVKEKRKENRLDVTYSDEGFLGCKMEGEVRGHLYTCQAGISIASILNNGDVGACNSLPRSLAQGNIRQDRFVDIWEKRYQIYRDRSWMKQGKCKNCHWWSNCLGNSLHLWDHEKQEPAYCHYHMLKEGK